MAQSVKFITDEQGTRIGVLMDLADYESLLEDLRDLTAIVDRRAEPTISHDELLKQLRAGHLPTD